MLGFVALAETDGGALHRPVRFRPGAWPPVVSGGLSFGKVGKARTGKSPPRAQGHFTIGGMEERIEVTLPPVFSPNVVPRS